jgi:hypothetical protein
MALTLSDAGVQQLRALCSEFISDEELAALVNKLIPAVFGKDRLDDVDDQLWAIMHETHSYGPKSRHRRALVLLVCHELEKAVAHKCFEARLLAPVSWEGHER